MLKFDFTSYLRRPRISATSGLVLAIRLFGAADKKPIPANVIAALTGVHTSAERLRLAVRARQRRSVGSKPAGRRFNAGWSGMHGRLDAWARQIDQAEAARAQALLDSLFPGGLTFLLANHEQEWIHSRELLERIDEEGHAKELEELAGPRFLQIVREFHDLLGEALGLDTTQPPEDADLAVGEEVIALAWAIATYGRVFSGVVIDEDTLELFLSAMKPIDEHRGRYRRTVTTADGQIVEAAEQPEDLEQGFEAQEDDDDDEVDLDLDQPLPPVPEGAQAP